MWLSPDTTTSLLKHLRILHTEASLGWGGQEIRIMEEMRWFRDNGHEIALVAPRNSLIFINATIEGFQTYHLTFTKNKLMSETFRMCALINFFNPDVIATHSSVDSWAGLIAGTMQRVRCRIRYRHVSTPIKGHILNRWQYRSLAHLVFTTGECISQSLLETFSISSGKVITAPTAIRVPDTLLLKSEATRQLQKELSLGSEAYFIGQVSVLRSWKGHKILIDAFASISDNFPNLHLVFVGGGPQEPMLTDLLSSHPLRERIHLVGFKSDPWPYFRAFNVAILASVSNEGIPQSLLQAMHAEIAVVGSNVGGIPEIVLDEKTGLLVEPSDASSLAKALNLLLDNIRLRESLATAAKKMVLSDFKWDRLGRRMENAIYEILSF